jgi:hypothetical protein
MVETILGPVLGALKWLGRMLLKSRVASQAHAREHDVALFKKGDTTVNESFLNDLLNSDLYYHRCSGPDIRAVSRFCTACRREENRFLDEAVAGTVDQAVSTLSELFSFVGKHFFTSELPNDSDRLFLNRTLRESPDETQRARYWNVLVPELNALTDAAWQAYKTYRATVRKRLMV